jgi:hypothetical protein
MRWLTLTFLTLSSAAPAAPSDKVGDALGAALQANERQALELLKDVDLAALPEKDRNFVTCARERFASPQPQPLTGTNVADQALSIYRGYWHSVLLQQVSREAGEHRLELALARFLHAKAGTRMDVLEPLLAKRLEAAGWHSLEGRTGYLRELMIWGKQDEKVVPVALPEGQDQAKVFYLNDFKSFGWSHYATCGRAATGGWATQAGLFAVVPRYDSLENEEFRVTFLGHETQHFADKARFKGLKDWELEYRAKLVELSEADATRAKVLNRFVDDQGEDPASPHSYANRAILNEMVRRLQLKGPDELFTVDLKRLQSAAADALVEDSRKREAAGAASAPAQR